MTNRLLASTEDETSEDHKENQNDDVKKNRNLFISNPNIAFRFINEKKILPKGNNDMQDDSKKVRNELITRFDLCNVKFLDNVNKVEPVC